MNYDLLKSKIKDKNFTIESLANKIGMTRSGLYSNFSNENMTVETLEKICNELGISVLEMYGHQEGGEISQNHNGNGHNNAVSLKVTESRNYFESLLEEKDERIKDLKQTIEILKNNQKQ